MSRPENIPPSERDKVSVIPPPPGVESNFIDPTNNGTPLLVAATFLLAFTILFFSFRVYAKLSIQRSIWWDDLSCGLSFIGTVIIYGCYVYDVSKGPNGKHEWDVSVKAMLNEEYSLTAYIYQVVFSPANYFAKLSVFLLYLQLFWPNRWLRILVYMGTAFSTAFYLSITLVITYLLTPKRRGEAFNTHMWSQEQVKAINLFVPVAVVGLVIDLFLLALPVKAVLGLEICWKRKVGVLLLFATGLFATIGSSLSIYYRAKIAKTHDATWYFAYAQIMTLIELFGGIICVCMPSLSKTLSHHSSDMESLFRRRLAPSNTSILSGKKDTRYQVRQRPLTVHRGGPRKAATVRLETLRNKNVVRLDLSEEFASKESSMVGSCATEDSTRQLLGEAGWSRAGSHATTGASSDALQVKRSDSIV